MNDVDGLGRGDERFAFGRNWTRFLSVVDEDRIVEAERSLRRMLERENLSGARFLDIGSGSGLFSLAAVRLGAAKVHSFDYDAQSVSATTELRRRYAPDAEHWTVERGSILDHDYVRHLGRWDVVYSWGVLHHTGEMEDALGRAGELVAPEGQLYIAIYNDQGWKSSAWRVVKRTCVALPPRLQPVYSALVYLPFELLALLKSVVKLDPLSYWRKWTEYGRGSRGMSHWHDVLDWVGGYPFEVAAPERIFDFYRRRGFALTKLVTNQGLGCSEYVFTRSALPAAEHPLGVAAVSSEPVEQAR